MKREELVQSIREAGIEAAANAAGMEVDVQFGKATLSIESVRGWVRVSGKLPSSLPRQEVLRCLSFNDRDNGGQIELTADGTLAHCAYFPEALWSSEIAGWLIEREAQGVNDLAEYLSSNPEPPSP